MKRSQKFRAYGVCLMLCALFCVCGAEASSYRDQSLEILNQWTSIRWGEENLAWAVYYPESLIEPWVRADAERRRLRADQIDAARAAFVDELRIGSASPILLTIQVFGTKPVDISPAIEKISLIRSDGSRVRPIVIEKRLEAPISGNVSGLIFFPKQPTDDFSIGVIGLVPERETIFTFDGALRAAGAIDTRVASSESTIAEPPVDEVVIRIPTAPKKEAPEDARPVETMEIGDEGETFAPTQAYQPTPDAPVMDDVPSYPDDFTDADEQDEMPPVMQRRTASKLSPRQVLDIYLSSWISGNTDAMYDQLTDDSRGRISKELFDREVLNSSFRKLLKSGYKVTWNGDSSAKVTVTRKLLFMRSLESKTINFTEEDGTARVVW